MSVSWCCRDLKDVLSQRSKVLFLDEPRMFRAAFVHFATHEDLERAQASFRNSQVLGSIVDIVPVRP
jgi:RNA recognition motif-containing protein